jgi:protein O-GlcNAc transferase
MNINKTKQSAFDYHKKGQYKQAEILYKKVLQKEPSNFDALHMLGVLCSQCGDHDTAISYIEKALRINSVNAYAYFNLGNAYKYKGLWDKSISSYRKSLELDPVNANVYFNLGVVQEIKGQFDEAITSYQKVLQFNPTSSEVHYNLGVVYQRGGRLHEAATYYQKSIQLNSANADAYNNLGIVLKEKNQIDESINCYRKAIQLNNNAKAYTNLGNAILLKDSARIEEAIVCHQKAIRIDRCLDDAYYNLGNAYKEKDKLNKAIAAYEMAIKCNSHYVKALWARCMSQLPVIYPDQQHILLSRESYHKELIYLRDTVSLETPQGINAAVDAVGSHQPFYLAYQGCNDRELQCIYGDLVCHIMSCRYPQFAVRPSMPSHATMEPLRIGIVSAYFHYHSNWKLPIKGWIENIDKNRFELYGYYTGRKKDQETALARQHFNRFIEDVYSFEELCRIIQKDNLHILVYPEIGMDPLTLKLAALRLAPVQCTSWGHPDTSGLPTIDYYLSSELMEPPNGDEHYTEQLIRLTNLSVYYTPRDISPVVVKRDSFGLRPESILYLCCQSLYKYLPQHDEVYPRIAKQLVDCQFMFIVNHKSKLVTDKFQSRIEKAFNKFDLDISKHVVFLPRLDPEHFHAINRMADIYLDSIGWSGCNSTFEALDCNLPVVTMPGAFMRGRHSVAILRMMEITETIALSIDEYISIAVKLGEDSGYRNHLVNKIAERKHLAYRDKTCIQALESFFEKTIKDLQSI